MLDYLIVGAGPFGCTFARLATDAGKSVKVIDKRDHIGGNTYTYEQDDIHVHKHGAHIFHTDDARIWRWVNQFSEWNQYHHTVKAHANNRIYTLPFCLTTMNEVFGSNTPAEAQRRLLHERYECLNEPRHLEEHALQQIGPTLYDMFVCGYTTKQWGTSPQNLPASIIKRLPVRMDWNTSYFNDAYVGIPADGYTSLWKTVLGNIPVELGVDFLVSREALCSEAHSVVYTGPIDAYFGYKHGRLGYRGLRFEHEVLDVCDYQGCAVVNYCDADVPYTRIIEHRHFDRNCKSEKTIITREYPHTPDENDEVYYPINNNENQARFFKYQQMQQDEHEAGSKTIFGGRLAEYRYYDMHQVIASAATTAKRLGIHSFL